MPEDGTTTKERLLDAAEELFAAKGFDGVSVRDLAAAAGVNVAAVGYHFHGKENLYHEVIRRRFTVQRDATLASLRRAVPREGEPRLEDIIRAIVGEYLRGALTDDRGTRFLAAVSREMHSDYDTRHTTVFRDMIAPIFAAFSDAMLAARPHLRQEDANWLIASVVGQIHHFIMRRVKFGSLPPGDGARDFMRHAFPVLAAPVETYVDEVTEHITRFSAAAIDGMHPEVAP